MKYILISLISLSYWIKFTVWQYVFFNYPTASQEEKVSIFIEKLNLSTLQNSADLYLLELVLLPFLILNVILIHSIHKRVKPIIFVILLMQGYFSVLLTIWQLL